MLRNDEFPIVVRPNEKNTVPDVIGAGVESGNVKRNRIMNELRMWARDGHAL
jgi:hypothetical protein